MLHLIRRFFGFLGAKPLSPTEQAFVTSALHPDLATLFYRQRHEDQRHAFEMAWGFSRRPDLVEAALLHDVGKSETHLGALGRSLATIWSVVPLPAPTSWSRYVDHGRIGAGLIAAAGAGDLTVAFARYHPGPAPRGIDPDDWHALEVADDA